MDDAARYTISPASSAHFASHSRRAARKNLQQILPPPSPIDGGTRTQAWTEMPPASPIRSPSRSMSSIRFSSGGVDSCQTAEFQAFVELLARHPAPSSLASEAVARAATTPSAATPQRGEAPSTPTTPNMLRAQSLNKQQSEAARQQAELTAARKQLMAEREAAAVEAAALNQQRRELEHVRVELEKALPAHAATRIQARARALRARVDVARQKDLKANELADTQARSEARAERREEKRRMKAALTVQRAFRRLRARREVKCLRAEKETRKQAAKAGDKAVKAAVKKSLGNAFKARMATRMQAAARGMHARKGGGTTPLPNAAKLLQLRERKQAKAAIEWRLKEAKAALYVQRAFRGLLGREEAGRVKQDAKKDKEVSKHLKQKRMADKKKVMVQQLHRSASVLRLQCAFRKRAARKAVALRRVARRARRRQLGLWRRRFSRGCARTRRPSSNK